MREPPSRAIMFPVIQADERLERKRVAPTMSDPLETLPRGMLSIM